MSERDALLGDIAAMWREADPMPADLVDKVLVAIGGDNLDVEYELLHLVERSRELEGVRGLGDAYTVVFSSGPYSLLLRVGTHAAGRRRVDGWLSPPQSMTVKVTQQADTRYADADETGRFEFEWLPAGLSRFWLAFTDSAAEPDHPFATPAFEL
ncbi:MAG: hypothetical protein H0V49_04580 [Nocardioidaceae bacterium]|nr:hypothetical protein [Nocardioidaceae bacterium]